MIGTQVALLFVLVAISALCSSSETAITSLGRTRVRLLADEYPKKRKSLQTLAENPNRLITTVLILNNLVNVAASSVATILFLGVLPEGLTTVQKGLITTFSMTITLLAFGEITPKNFAKNNAERYSLWVLNPIYFFSVILEPLIWVFRHLSENILGLMGEDFAGQEPTKVSEEQIKALIDLAKNRSLFDKHEAEMMKRIFSYDDLTAREVMVPRTEVKTIEASTTVDEARMFVAKMGHSRYPVHSGQVDEIIGTLYSKDLIEHSIDNYEPVEKIVRPAYYTPITKPINALLREFQKERVHLAVVIDEYSGVAGIITLEDILEEIVGEIEDEFDTQEELIEELSSEEAIAAGDAEVKHVNRALNIDLPEEDITLGGLLMHHLEDIPEKGDQLSLNGVTLIVEQASERQIQKIRIKYGKSADTDES